MLPIYMIVYCAFFDTHSQMPVLAPYALSLGATPFLLGVVVGSYSISNILGNFVSGAIIDRSGWQKPLLFGLSGVSLALFFYTLADSPLDLIAARAWHGLVGGILVPAALACLTNDEKHAAHQAPRLAYFGVSIGLAAVTGPPIAGFIAANFGYRAVYYSLFALMLSATLAAAVYLATEHRESTVRHTHAENIYKSFATSPLLQTALVFSFGVMGATGVLATFLPSRAQVVGLDSARTGMLFAVFALSAIVVQLLWSKVIPKFAQKNYKGCTAGLLLIGLALLMIQLAASSITLFIALFVFGTGFGLTFQGMLGLVMEGSQAAWRGRAIGSFFAAYSLGAALLPPFSGLLWQNFSVIIPFYTAAVSVMTCLLVGRKLASKIDSTC
ncbi:MAG TPA: MFS transporter [Candidatus Limnocylindrales bacterium]|nr:MFS transporter [Candidatus Limnocylindrales bacterium]